jgi:hypothetical protein
VPIQNGAHGVGNRLVEIVPSTSTAKKPVIEPVNRPARSKIRGNRLNTDGV